MTTPATVAGQTLTGIEGALGLDDLEDTLVGYLR